jgi:TolA-binding protein
LEERCKRGEMVDCNKLPSAYLQLARLYEAEGNSEKAKEYYEAILKEFPPFGGGGGSKEKAW